MVSYKALNTSTENGDFIIGMEKGKEYALAYIIFELGNIVETFKGEK